jgi:7-cyano-7-deazaguanine reductase
MPRKKAVTGGSEYQPRYLGRPVEGPIDRVERIPWTGGEIHVRLDCAEFTTLCPVTGQPDFGNLLIEYQPDCYLVETKSLKLFLQGYRDKRAFNEQIVAELASRLFQQLQPHWLRVTGHYNARGGIALTCVAEQGAVPDFHEG